MIRPLPIPPPLQYPRALRGWAFIAIGALTLSGCGAEDPGDVEPPLRPVRTVVVGEAAGQRKRVLSGSAQAANSSVMSFKVSGTINQVAVSVGDTVDAGALLASLDDSDYQLQLRDAQAGLSAAIAQSRQAKSGYDRARELYVNQQISQSQLESARASYEGSQAQVSSASQRVKMARSQIEYAKLLAVQSGTVADVMVSEGENASPGRPAISLTLGDGIDVKVAAPEAIISQVRRGDPAEVAFEALGEQRYMGVVSSVGVTPTQME
ncbi:MAG: efflux RND transporter periplasmic adaptor subunit, partial [Myxococcota bacterium]